MCEGITGTLGVQVSRCWVLLVHQRFRGFHCCRAHSIQEQIMLQDAQNPYNKQRQGVHHLI